jgi:hypothetical protein
MHTTSCTTEQGAASGLLLLLSIGGCKDHNKLKKAMAMAY